MFRELKSILNEGLDVYLQELRHRKMGLDGYIYVNPMYLAENLAVLSGCEVEEIVEVIYDHEVVRGDSNAY